MRRLLMICYDFPPSSVGIWRTVKFCQYMVEFGWQPSVLTVKDVRGPLRDNRPLEDLPPETEIRRTDSLDIHRLAWIWSRLRGANAKARGARATNERGRAVANLLRRWLFVPDDRAPWMSFALRAGRKWINEGKFDAIYSTSFPPTAHVIGATLAREANLPFLADFRDIWIGYYQFYNPPTRWHDRAQRRLESEVVKRAGRVVSATRPIMEDFLERYPDEPFEKFLTITNGFDPVDWEDVMPRPVAGHFTISYVGLMYGETSPEVFLRAVAKLLERAPSWRDFLRLRFVGAMIEPYDRMIDAHGLRAITSVEPYIPHEAALQAMVDADALLLLVADAPGSHIMLTQKVFEYLAARRPIIALVPEGAARDLLQDVGDGALLDTKDAEGTERAIERLLNEWEANGRRATKLPANPRLKSYERRALTQKLCAALDSIIAK